MRKLSSVDMLNIWERGLNQPLLQRALLLLVAACPETEPDALAELSIGQRDLRLMKLREHLFGASLINMAICPECSEQIEWENEITDLVVPSVEKKEPNLNEFDLKKNKYQLHFRLPNSLDIAEVINCNNAEIAQQLILTRCIMSARHLGKDCAIDKLPDDVIDALNQRIETLDPQAEISIKLTCPECSHSWNILFDITSFLWSEIDDWAERTLQIVHKLAKGYGWTEQVILNLSPVRRQLYLGMLGS